MLSKKFKEDAMTALNTMAIEDVIAILKKIGSKQHKSGFCENAERKEQKMIKSFYVAWGSTLSEWANLRSEPTLNYTEEQRKEHKKALEQCQDELAKILLPNTSFKDMPNSDRLLKRALEIALSYYDERFSSSQMVFELVEDIAEYVKYSFALLGKKGSATHD